MERRGGEVGQILDGGFDPQPCHGDGKQWQSGRNCRRRVCVGVGWEMERGEEVGIQLQKTRGEGPILLPWYHSAANSRKFFRRDILVSVEWQTLIKNLATIVANIRSVGWQLLWGLNSLVTEWENDTTEDLLWWRAVEFLTNKETNERERSEDCCYHRLKWFTNDTTDRPERSDKGHTIAPVVWWNQLNHLLMLVRETNYNLNLFCWWTYWAWVRAWAGRKSDTTDGIETF